MPYDKKRLILFLFFRILPQTFFISLREVAFVDNVIDLAAVSGK